MKKNITLILIFFITFSNYSFSDSHSSQKKINVLYFDVVEKELVMDNTLDADVAELAKNNFDNKIKVNGFDGIVKISLFDYKELISTIDKSKRVDLSIQFKKEIIKQKFQQKTNQHFGKINSYGSIEGRFSISDFEKMKKDVQWELIERLFKELSN